jgi:hypothetical protein
MDVVALLRSKNKCLERFLSVSAEFLSQVDNGDISGLKRLEERREACLKAVDLYDRKVAHAVSLLPSGHNPDLADQVRQAMERRHALVDKIVRTDARIVAKIEEIRGRILDELIQARKSKNLLTKFKSAWVTESGEGIDTKL